MDANKRQVGGGHYRNESGNKMQHWDLVAEYGWDYFQAQIIKYLMRHKRKNGVEDLRKAQHFLEKYIEVRQASDTDSKAEMPLAKRVGDPTREYVDQDRENNIETRCTICKRTGQHDAMCPYIGNE